MRNNIQRVFNYKQGRYLAAYVSGTSFEPLLGQTIPQVQRSITEQFPDREAYKFIESGAHSTLGAFETTTNRIAANLLEIGLKPKDRIGIWSANHLEWIETQFAAAKAGLILVNVNPNYTAHELDHVLKKCAIKALVSDNHSGLQNFEKVFQTAISKNNYPDLAHVFWRKKPAIPNVIHNEEFAVLRDEPGSSYSRELEEIIFKMDSDEPVNIQFTSGTTGSPKGATLSHHNVLNNANQFSSGNRMNITKNDTILANSPLYHCMGCVLSVLPMILYGTKIVFPNPTFKWQKSLEAVQKEQCNVWLGTPTMFVDMLNGFQKEFKEPAQFCETKYTAFMSGAMCPEPLLLDLKEKMNCDVFVGYGTTENSPLTFLQTQRDNLNQRTTTIGTVMPHTEAKIVDGNGQLLPRGAKGEINTRGTCVFQGYWEQSDATAEAVDKNGWYHTGDLGIMREDGYVTIVGRSKDMIIRGGENIYPAEIENTLMNHPLVVDVHVIGVPSKRLGEEVAAYMRTKTEVPEEEIKRFCSESLSYFKVPKYIKFVNDYPMTVTGKVQKFKLREQAIHDFELDL